MGQKSLIQNGIPVKTVERLLTYKVILHELLEQQKDFIRSYELAEFANNKPEQVRRDVMSIDYIGNPAKGYEIKLLLKKINKRLNLKAQIKVGIVGFGRLGTSILSYFKEHKTRIDVVAVFDTDTSKIKGNETFFNIDRLQETIEKEQITLIILAIPAKSTHRITEILNKTNIKGILNFTPVQLKVKKGITVNRIDITLEMEKLIFYCH